METIEKYLIERNPGGSAKPGKYTSKLVKIDKKLKKNVNELKKLIYTIDAGVHTDRNRNHVHDIDRFIEKKMMLIYGELESFEDQINNLTPDFGKLTRRSGF